ncbi:MAG: universal stress protein, partial [Lacisediminihabitans sp.]
MSSPAITSAEGPVVVGVLPHQPDSVVITAAAFARRFGTSLICANVNSSRYTVEERPDGTVVSLPFDPDIPELREEIFDRDLGARIALVLDPLGVDWSSRALAGEPARALAHL